MDVKVTGRCAVVETTDGAVCAAGGMPVYLLFAIASVVQYESEYNYTVSQIKFPPLNSL